MDIIFYLTAIIEILVIAGVVGYFLSFFWDTRTMDIIVGLTILMALFIFSRWFNFQVLERLIDYIVSILPLAILIIFQQELRLALSKLSIIRKGMEELAENEYLVELIASTVYRIAARNIGALIAFERQNSLAEYAQGGVILNSELSSELLESIFLPTSPLHDGAVILRGNRIFAAATILPLADDGSQLARSMGTRHRAALGLSQLTDALIVVVSEETGKVSVAREGVMTRGIKGDKFKAILRTILDPKEIEQELSPLRRLFLNWKRGFRKLLIELSQPVLHDPDLPSKPLNPHNER
jgi:uncharacterized protein (TIGR00159 family)